MSDLLRCEFCADRGYAYQCDDPDDRSVPCPMCGPNTEGTDD